MFGDFDFSLQSMLGVGHLRGDDLGVCSIGELKGVSGWS
jgi:hypothetical protein